VRFAYIGNFEPLHSTENHVRKALVAGGHEVLVCQENIPAAWESLCIAITRRAVDVVLWTHTQFPDLDHGVQRRMLDDAAQYRIPTVGYHLDRWWGLAREHLVHEEPFFQCDVVCTADGGHEDEWAAAGVEHRWFPPAVLGAEATSHQRARPGFAADVAFVGSWQDYHPEWRYRIELVEWLRATFGDRLAVYPQRGRPSIRGQALRDVYASVKVVVGDSCLSGGITRYWSDRVPETLGRGGFLIHPWVDGMGDHFEDDRHFVSYSIGEFDQLRELIEFYVANTSERDCVAGWGREHVLKHHTYEVRMRDLVALIEKESQ